MGEEYSKINRLRQRDIEVFKAQETHIQKLEAQNQDLLMQLKGNHI